MLFKTVQKCIVFVTILSPFESKEKYNRCNVSDYICSIFLDQSIGCIVKCKKTTFSLRGNLFTMD